MLGVVAAIFSALLVATGITKLWRPHDTARALRAIGLPLALGITYALAVGEILVGGIALATAATWSLWAQTGLYAAFLGWIAVALRQEIPLASCGCLGRSDTPPSWGHVAVNAMAVIASSATAISGSLMWAEVGALPVVTHLVLVVSGAWLAWHIIGVAATATMRRPT